MSFDLRAERINRGLTAVDLARELELSRHTIMRIEDGARPLAPTAKKIADWLGRPASELWPTDPTPEEQAA